MDTVESGSLGCGVLFLQLQRGAQARRCIGPPQTACCDAGGEVPPTPVVVVASAPPSDMANEVVMARKPQILSKVMCLPTSNGLQTHLPCSLGIKDNISSRGSDGLDL